MRIRDERRHWSERTLFNTGEMKMPLGRFCRPHALTCRRSPPHYFAGRGDMLPFGRAMGAQSLLPMRATLAAHLGLVIILVAFALDYADSDQEKMPRQPAKFIAALLIA